MPSWMAWVQRPSGPFKEEESISAFMGAALLKGMERFVEANIDNWSEIVIR